MKMLTLLQRKLAKGSKAGVGNSFGFAGHIKDKLSIRGMGVSRGGQEGAKIVCFFFYFFERNSML